MKKNEINELINIYEEQGIDELVTKLYQIQEQHKNIELNAWLSAYMHLTNQNNHSYFYTSDIEQAVTNNTGSVICFNRKIFDFKNINDRKIVIKESFCVSKEEMLEILKAAKQSFGTSGLLTNNIDFINNAITVCTKENCVDFNKKEFELITKLLNNPSFRLSNNSSSLYIEGKNGYAYMKGIKKRK